MAYWFDYVDKDGKTVMIFCQTYEEAKAKLDKIEHKKS